MTRAVCIVSREYPPETAFGGIARIVEMTARALVDEGVAVHVLSLSTTGMATVALQDGVVVHRLPDPGGVGADTPYVHAGLWSHVVAAAYRTIDEQVRFDVVHAQDHFAEALHLVVRPDTRLVVQLHGLGEVIHPRSSLTPGQQALHALELVALRRADALVAPSSRIVADLDGVVADHPPATVLPPPFEVARFAGPPLPAPDGDGRLRLLFLGRLEANKGPEHAIRTLAELHARGVPSRLTMVGRDVPGGAAGSYRRSVLLPLLASLGLSAGDVRFVEQLDADGVRRHLRAADVAILPSLRENLHVAAVEAVAAGVPVVCGSVTGVTDWLGEDDGLRAFPVDDTFAAAAADAALDVSWRANARARGAAAARGCFEPSVAIGRWLDYYRSLADPAAPFTVSRDDVDRPELAIVVLAHNALAYTKRCVRSVLAHTTRPFRLLVVDNASTDGTADWVASLGDPRVELIRSDVNTGVSGGRNLGLAHVPAAARWIAFLDNDVEVSAAWCEPFLEVLELDDGVAIAGEQGVRITIREDDRAIEPLSGTGPIPCDMAIGFCMVMRAEAVRQVGRFDEALGLFWHDDDDYGMRARRLGWGVSHVGSGRVLHFEHRSSETVDGIWAGRDRPSELSDRNQRYLAEKWRRQLTGIGVDGARALPVLAFADELIADPSLLAGFAAAFGEDDDATLVVYAPGADPVSLEADLVAAMTAAGLDLDGGPDLLALAPPAPTAEEELVLANGVAAVWSRRSVDGRFGAPPRYGPGAGPDLRALADRVWLVARYLRGEVAR